MREQLILKATGLATFADTLSKVPEGSLSVAKNIVIDKDGLVSPRRGYEVLDGVDSLGDISSIHPYASEIIIHSGTTMSYFNGTLWTALSSPIATPSDANKIRSVTYNNNIYFTSAGGVQKLDSLSGDLVDTGAPRGLNAILTEKQPAASYGSAIPGTGGSGTQTVAYRVLWGYRDANDNLIKGSPSQREVFSHGNTDATDVDLKIFIPSTITTAWFYQIYRSDAVTTGEPLDELRLAYEGNPVSGDITNGYVTVTDVQPESMLGEALYTNSTQQGILQANDEPPKCRDMAVYQSHVFYANTETKYQQEIQLLGVNPCDRLDALITGTPATMTVEDSIDFPSSGDFIVKIESEDIRVNVASGTTLNIVTRGFNSTSVVDHASGLTVSMTETDATGTTAKGLSEGDTVVIDGVTFTAKYKDTPASQEFRIYSVSDPANDVEQTARSLVSQLNAYLAANNSDVSALYISLGDTTSLPGKILLQERDYAAAGAFETSATSIIDTEVIGYTWTPELSTAQTATNERKKNRVYFSKFQVPEAVPALNFFDVGAANDEIIRILPLRSELLIFTAAGIYRLTGTVAASFQVTLLDNTTKLLAPDSAVVFNNAVFGLFDQGIGSVSGQVNILSRAIEGDILEIRGAIGDDISKTFGIGYESDRKFMVFMPTISGGAPDIGYVYNTVTNSWTTYDLTYNHGIVNPADDKIYLVGEDTVVKERKNFTDFDITDTQTYGHITSVTGVVLGVDSNLAGTSNVGDLLLINSKSFSTILEIDTGANTITVVDDLEYPEPTTLNGAIDDAVTTLDLTDGSSYTEGDTVLIGTENILLGVKDTNQFTGCTRGYRLTTAASHNDLADVYETCEVRASFEVDIEWNPVTMDHPSTLKQFSECTVLTNRPLKDFTLGFKTWTSAFYDRVSFVSDTSGFWGTFPWGEVPWGGEVDVTRYRTYVPRAKQRDSAITLRITQDTIYNNFEISGFSIMYRFIGSKTER